VIAQREGMRRAADDEHARDPFRPNRIAHEPQVRGIASIGQFRPFGFGDLHPAAGIDDEVDFARTVAPEEERTGLTGPPRTMAKLGEDERVPDQSRRG
jgi:hypothetical protein